MTDEPVSRRNILAGSLAGLGLIVRRPLAVPVWALLAWPAVFLLVGGQRLLNTFRDPVFVIGPLGGLLACIVMLRVLEAAALRLVLQPETAGLTGVRLDRRVLNMVLGGFVRPPAPLKALLAVLVGFIVVAALIATAILSGIPILLVPAFLLGRFGLAGGALVLAAKTSVRIVPLFLQRPSATSLAMDRTDGHTAALSGLAAIGFVVWSLSAWGLWAVWKALSGPVFSPGVLFTNSVPVDQTGWMVLATETGTVSLLLAVAMALLVAIRTPPLAEAWRLIGDSGELKARRSLFAVA